MDKCKECGKEAELVDGLCSSCKSIEDKVNAKLAAKETKPVENKIAGEAKTSEPEGKERLDGLMKALVRRDRNRAEELSDNAAKTFDGVGYLIPQEYGTQIYELMESYGVARQYCYRHPMATETAQLPKLITGLAMTFVGSTAHTNAGWKSGARKPTTAGEIGKVDISIRDVAGVFPVAKKTVEDTNTNFATLIPAMFANAATYAEDNALFNGVAYGSGGDVGGLIDDGTEVEGDGAAFADCTISDLVNLQANLESRALQGAAYFMHPSVKVLFHQALLSATYAGRMTLEEALGYPIVLSSAMPAVGDSAASTGFVVLGNLSNVYLADREQMSIDIAEEATIYDAAGDVAHALFQDNMLGFRAVERIDIKTMSDEAFAVLTTKAS